MLLYLCFVGFAVALVSAHTMAVPPHVFAPQPTKYLGRWVYLTYWSNVTGVMYYSASLLDTSGKWRQPLLDLFPLMFAVGCFLTLAYYGLDHFNVEVIRQKERCRSEYPYVHLAAHLEHGHALPLVLLHAFALDVSGLQVPDSYLYTSAVLYILCFILCYLLTIHLNRIWTGSWTYSVIDDVTHAYGNVGRFGFFFTLAAAFVVFGIVGLHFVVRAAQQQG